MLLKTIQKFENDERLVILSYYTFDNTYIVSILTKDYKSNSRIYKSGHYALRKFSEFKCRPLKALGVR